METVATMMASTAMEVGATETAGSLFAFAEGAGGLGSMLAGGFSVMSGLANMSAQSSASRMQSQQYENMATQMELKARQEETRGMQEANIIKQRTLRVLASNTAAAGGRGIDINSGSASQIQDEVLRQSSKQLAVNKTNTEIASLADEISAYNYRADAAYTLDVGASKARSSLFETAARTLSRGGSSIMLNP